MSRAPVAALTIGGTTGISQPPNAASGRGPQPGEHQVGHGQAAGQAGQRAQRPQHRVDHEGGLGADQPRAEQQRSRPHGQQRHRRRPVELHHDRVPGVAQCGLPVPGPVHDLGRGQHQEPSGGQHPDGRGEAAQSGPLDRQGGRRCGHDAGAHHRGEPVGTQAGEGVGGPFQVAERATVAGAGPVPPGPRPAGAGPAGRGPAGAEPPGGGSTGRGGRCGRAGGHDTSLARPGHPGSGPRPCQPTSSACGRPQAAVVPRLSW